MIKKILLGVLLAYIGFWVLVILWPFLFLLLSFICAWLIVAFIYAYANDETSKFDKIKKRERNGR